MVLAPGLLTPPLPGAPLTLPSANAFSMTPLLKPTKPPPVPFAPTLTLPHAVESAIEPKFCPARPPAETVWQELLAAHPIPLGARLAVVTTFPVAYEELMTEPGELDPTRPPRLTLMPALPSDTSAPERVIEPGPKAGLPFAPTSPPATTPAPVPPSI